MVIAFAILILLLLLWVCTTLPFQGVLVDAPLQRNTPRWRRFGGFPEMGLVIARRGYSTLKRRVSLLLALALFAPACGAGVAPFIVDALKTVTSIATVVESLQVHADTHFTRHPDEALQGEVNAVLQDVRDALLSANDAGEGAKALDQGDVQAANARLTAAYLRAVEVCKRINVRFGDPGDRRLSSPEPGALQVPRPEALGL